MNTYPSWDKLPMRERAAYIGVGVRNGFTNLQDIRKQYNEFAKGGRLSDQEYYTIMEKVARDNWQKWEDASEDAALERILNDNSYDYRGYYEEDPEGAANASTHWPDTYKTFYHPTFSDESVYSGKQSQYNPAGAIGGHWVGKTYFPVDAYHQAARYDRQFAQGGNLYGPGGWIRQQDINGRWGWMDMNTGRFTYTDPKTGQQTAQQQANATVNQTRAAA